MEPAGAASLSRSLSIFAKLATAALIVAVVGLARPVLMPIAFAGVLAFILSAPMRWLRHRMPKLPALALLMLLTVSVLGSATYVIAVQLNDLTTQLGTYTESMRRKLAALHGGDGPLARVEVMIARVTEGLEQQVESVSVPVQVMPAQISPVARSWGQLEPLAGPLMTVLFVLVLCIFVLGQRDDLRNRLIRIVGTRNVMATTRTLDEGAQRVMRYLLTQTMINAAFGTAVGVGLYVIGVPYAALCGVIAALARFVPYLGAIASLLLPSALAFAVFPGWTEMLFTVGLFVGVDVLVAYAIEPLVIGHRTGVSPIALLVSVGFWTWLWGPAGLVLATPITVALAVLGRHVPDLRLLSVLLGDDQVIGTEISFYQRLLARDEDEAAEIARARQSDVGPTGVMDEIIIPTLVLAARDLGHKEISSDDHAFIVTWSRDIFEHLLVVQGGALETGPVRALGIAAHRSESALLLEMLSVVVKPEQGALEVLSEATPLDEVLRRIERLKPEVVCIAALPPEGGPYARQLCHRIKQRFGDIKIVAFRPNEPGIDPGRAATRLQEAGADAVVATLTTASAELSRLLQERRDVALVNQPPRVAL